MHHVYGSVRQTTGDQDAARLRTFCEAPQEEAPRPKMAGQKIPWMSILHSECQAQRQPGTRLGIKSMLRVRTDTCFFRCVDIPNLHNTPMPLNNANFPAADVRHFR